MAADSFVSRLLNADRLLDNDSHSHCVACDYFAQGKVVTPHTAVAVDFAPGPGGVSTVAERLPSHVLSSNLARGPPLFV
ncbi:MAG: hypothetical protein WD070_06455 [Pirellulaceae bacterium]